MIITDVKMMLLVTREDVLSLCGIRSKTEGSSGEQDLFDSDAISMRHIHGGAGMFSGFAQLISKFELCLLKIKQGLA